MKFRSEHEKERGADREETRARGRRRERRTQERLREAESQGKDSKPILTTMKIHKTRTLRSEKREKEAGKETFNELVVGAARGIGAH